MPAFLIIGALTYARGFFYVQIKFQRQAADATSISGSSASEMGEKICSGHSLHARQPFISP